MGRFIDLTGQRFGRLVVLERVSEIGKTVFWQCRCDCGNVIAVSRHSLRDGKTKSCGCLRQEVMRLRATKHGHCFEKLHGVWQQMKQRCNNQKNKNYEWYGARGIRVCPEWESYEVFRRWALQNGYCENLTIERKDPDENYCPENCTWITLKAQQQNRRSGLSYRAAHQ